MPRRNWRTTLSIITGVSGIDSSAEHEKAPSSNLQGPEKLQAPGSNEGKRLLWNLPFGICDLELLWSLEVEAWSFCPGLLPVRAGSLFIPGPNQHRHAWQPLLAHRRDLSVDAAALAGDAARGPAAFAVGHERAVAARGHA